MKIYSFGNDRATGYRFDVLKAADDWSTTRASVAKNIGGSDGAFDYLKTYNYPVNPLIVSKTFDLPSYYQFAGTGVATLAAGFQHVYGAGSSFDTEAQVGDRIAVSESILTVSAVATSIDCETIEAGAETPIGPYHTYTIIRPSMIDYASLDLGLDLLRHMTIAKGELKLWAQMRDGTYLWTPAKCIAVTANEKMRTRLSIPVSLSFYCHEGLWYGETLHTHEFTTETTFSANNAGNYPAMLSCDVLAGASPASAVVLQAGSRAITWTGTLAANKHLIVSSSPNKITNDGAGAYGGVALTNAYKYEPWLQLAANGNTTIALQPLSDPVASATYSWYDTYLL